LSLAVVPAVEIVKALVRDDGVEANVRNRSARDAAVRVSLDVFRNARRPAAQSLSLAPGAEACVTLPAAWPDLSGARVPQTVRVAAEAEGLTTVRSLVVGPPLVNGSFEMAVINGDKPEGWSIFGNGAHCVHVVRENAFDGGACLHIEPGPGSPNVDQVCHLRPDTTYRLSAALRRPDVKDRPTVWITICETAAKPHTWRLQYPKADRTVNAWRVFSVFVKTPPQIAYTLLYACNAGRVNPIGIDAVRIEKVE